MTHSVLRLSQFNFVVAQHFRWPKFQAVFRWIIFSTVFVSILCPFCVSCAGVILRNFVHSPEKIARIKKISIILTYFCSACSSQLANYEIPFLRRLFVWFFRLGVLQKTSSKSQDPTHGNMIEYIYEISKNGPNIYIIIILQCMHKTKLLFSCSYLRYERRALALAKLRIFQLRARSQYKRFCVCVSFFFRFDNYATYSENKTPQSNTKMSVFFVVHCFTWCSRRSSPVMS